MANNVKAPVIDNPELLDRIIGNIQNGLVDNLPWLHLAGRKDLLNTTGTKSDIIRQMFIPAITIIWK
jgi:hypothetical protein